MTLIWMAVGLVILIAFAFLVSTYYEATWRRSGALPPAGQATMADVERLVASGKRIMAIRCYREIHGVGLKEAKQAIEALSRRQ